MISRNNFDANEPFYRKTCLSITVLAVTSGKIAELLYSAINLEQKTVG